VVAASDEFSSQRRAARPRLRIEVRRVFWTDEPGVIYGYAPGNYILGPYGMLYGPYPIRPARSPVVVGDFEFGFSSRYPPLRGCRPPRGARPRPLPRICCGRRTARRPLSQAKRALLEPRLPTRIHDAWPGGFAAPSPGATARPSPEYCP